MKEENSEGKSEEVKEEINIDNRSETIENLLVDETENKSDDRNINKKTEQNDEKVIKVGKKGNNKKILIVCFCFISLLIIAVGSFFCYTKMYSRIFKNVYILNDDMSGKTQDEVLQYLNSLSENINNKFKNDEFGIDVYQSSESIYKILPSEIEVKIDVAKTLQDIFEYGRNNNILNNAINVIKALFGKVEISLTFSYNEAKIDEILKNVELTVKDRFVDDKYNIDEKTSKLIITRGTTGNTVNLSVEKEKLINMLKDKAINNNVDDSLKLDIITKSPSELDLDKVYSEVKREPQNAYIDRTKTPIEIVSEKLGYDFNVNDLKKILNEDENKIEGKEVEYQLTIIEPTVKLSDITNTLYTDKIAEYTTYFQPGVYARSTNLKIALSYLDGKIIMPGEVFSYNDAVGDVNAAKGYQSAAVFKGGTTVNEIGGGICQTTSTLYNVALLANLEIVERYQHGLPVGYVPPSLDATVYSPTLDFKFKNTRKYPIKIKTSFSYNGSLSISFYGTKEEVEYDVILTSKTLKTIYFTTKYIYDDTLPEGQQVVVSAGVNGYQSESYITKKLNGQVVSSKLLSSDTYKAQQQVVKIGTKK